MAQVASWAAGKPVSVWCENDDEAWQRMLTSVGAHTDAAGYAYPGANEIFVSPSACRGLIAASWRDVRFATGLSTLLHEATHARGWRDEALTECAARVLIYSALHDYYGYGWFSIPMEATVANALRESLRGPAGYQGGCARL